MSDNSSPHDGNQNTTTRVLAGVLSPWAILFIAACIIGIIYQLYYKPRLFYSYRSYPKSPRIYCVPPYLRRRKFRKDPVAYLSDAKGSLSTSSVFWTDVVKGYGSKTMSLVSEDSLILQFLTTDDRDQFSWDAPLRSAWDPLFDRSSSFGKRASFYGASRYCLIQGFSPARTSASSRFGQILQSNVTDSLATFVEGDLCQLVEHIVLTSLLQILFGNVSTDLTETIRAILSSLSSSSNDTKSLKLLGENFRRQVQAMIQVRLEDLEQHADTGDYLQWLLKNQSDAEMDAGGRKTTSSFSADTPDIPDQASSDSSTQDGAEASKQRREDLLKRDLPDHLLATILQTHLLATTCTTWAVYSSATLDNNISPDPLLLVRYTRREMLLGSTVIPKKIYIAISPVLERTKPMFNYNAGSDGKHTLSTTELANLSAMNSTIDLHDHIQENGFYGGMSHSPSNGSFSPLLRSNKYSSTTSMADSSETTAKAGNEATYKSRKGSWIRRYPQGHLVSLIVGCVSNTLSTNLAVTGSATIKPEYGTARTLWLPFPSSSIAVLKAPSNKRPPTSLYSRSRSGSITYMSKAPRVNGEVNIIDEQAE